jgi:hypothetical protein
VNWVDLLYENRRRERAEAVRRAEAQSARLSGVQVAGGATIRWDRDTAVTDAQSGAILLLAAGLRDGDLIEYGAADVRAGRDDSGDLTVFVTEVRDGATRVYLLDEEGGRHDAAV